VSLWNLYVGTFTAEFKREFKQEGRPSLGIERFSFDDTKGAITHVDTVSDLISPQYLALHPKLPVLYATEFAHPGALVAFSIHEDGKLERRSRSESLGEQAVAVSIHPALTYAYVANWGDGTVAAFRLDSEGVVLDPQLIGPMDRRDGRSESEHPAHSHHVRITPNGNYVLVAYQGGLDELAGYRTDPDGTPSSSPIVRIEFPVGSGPRHIEFHPSGERIYVVGEEDSRLYVLEADQGLPIRILKSYSTRPAGFEGRNRPSELDLRPGGRTLYIGNRGSDCVAIVSLDNSGDVEAVDHQSSLGRNPRAVRVDPTGRHLLVAHKDSGNLVLFAIDDAGQLRPVGEPSEVPTPSSVVLSRLPL
jgi:6-phosphogluconolactonase